MTEIIRILFVCQKNVTLSPMAAQIFSHLIRKKKLNDCFKVDSAAVLDDSPVGIPISDTAKACLEKAGIDAGSHLSHVINAEMAEKFDWIVCMTEFGRRKAFDVFRDNAVYVTPKDVRRVFKSDPASQISHDGRLKPRVCCLMDFTGFSRDVIDPDLTGDYRLAFNELSLGCNSIISLAPFGNRLI